MLPTHKSGHFLWQASIARNIFLFSLTISQIAANARKGSLNLTSDALISADLVFYAIIHWMKR